MQVKVQVLCLQRRWGQILKVELNVLVSPPASGTIIGPVA